jgi:DNA repair protein RecN (Recombination protein N)
MLAELRIKDLAIVDEIDIVFSRGLNVLTGETGAGKSIIINSVNMLLGDRTFDGLIRTGAEAATAEALFDISDHAEIEEKLRAIGVDDAKELLIKRMVASSGRSRVFVNGTLSTLALISRIGEILLSIYGQNEHQNLQRAERHLDILDEYGGLNAFRTQYEESFHEMDGLIRELQSLREAEDQLIKDRELMRFQSQEIAAAQLKENEEETLQEQRRILSNAEKLFERADAAETILYSGESSVSEKLHTVLQNVEEIARIDPSIDSLAKTLESSIYQLEEVAYSLRDYRGKIEYDPDGLEAVEHRLDELQRLKKKYGPTIQDILQFKERVDDQLERLDSRDERTKTLEERLVKAQQKTIELGRTLSQKRKGAATAFERVMEEELGSLGMANTVFEVRFDVNRSVSREKWIDVVNVSLGPRGMDTAEFYISPNVGEEPRPLSRIASGGELSRIMLAIKRIIASAEPGQTLIFDEVDAGIGGAVAEVVGKKLKDLSSYHQVVCVTHLPQIACFADVHHRVTKSIRQNRTRALVEELDSQERIDEIARMLGGLRITEKTRAHATEMIENARKAVDKLS